MAVASAAPVLVSTGGPAPIKLGDTTPAGRVGTRLHVWNWEKSPTSRVLDADTAGEFALTPDGSTLLIGDGRAIDLATGKATGLAWWGDAGLNLRPAWLRFSPDGKTLLAFEHDQKVGTARLIDYPAGTERGRAGGLWWAGSRGAFSADGKALALYGSDAHLRAFDAATGKERTRFAPEFANTIQSVAVSADGARAAGSYGGNVRVWDAATGKLVCEPETADLGLHPEFYTAAFSPDGKQLAAGGGGVQLVLWNAATGKRVRTFPRESMGAEHVRFDAAGATITTVNGFHGHRTREGADVTVYPTVGTWRVTE
jgi:outer membrane protein assembly factor BamB